MPRKTPRPLAGTAPDPGMADRAFVQAITTRPGLETVFVSTGSGGIGVSMKKR